MTNEQREDVVSTTPLYSGFLMKRGIFNKSYKKRYFEFLGDGTLNYYMSQPQQSQQKHQQQQLARNGHVTVNRYTIIAPNPSKQFGFTLSTSTTSRLYELSALSQPEYNRWMQILSQYVSVLNNDIVGENGVCSTSENAKSNVNTRVTHGNILRIMIDERKWRPDISYYDYMFEMNYITHYEYIQYSALTINSFTFLSEESDTFHKVIYQRNQKIYSMKICKKQENAQRTLNEKSIHLLMRDCSSVLPLRFAFQDFSSFYLIFDYFDESCTLFNELTNQVRFSVEFTRQIVAQIVQLLDQLHSKCILHNHLTLHDIILNKKSNKIQFIHMDQSVLLPAQQPIVNNVDEYTPYECCCSVASSSAKVKVEEEHIFSRDYWQLGIIMYEMLIGVPPFLIESEEDNISQSEMKRIIETTSVKFPKFVTSDAQSLIYSLLTLDPSIRLGVHGAQEVRNHVFFNGYDWSSTVRQAKPIQ